MKKITLLKSLTLLIALFCTVNFGFGQSIFKNDIISGEDLNSPHDYNPYTIGQELDPNITTFGIERGPGLSKPITTPDRFNARSWSIAGIDLDDYFELTLTPNAGYEIDFSNFVYTYRKSPEGPKNIAIRSSIDSFSNDIVSFTSGPSSTDIPAYLDLSNVIYQNITSAITFRIYGWNAISGNGTFSINDFTFNGVVSFIGTCSAPSVAWTSSGWIPNAPTINTPVAIDYDYDTSAGGEQTSFSACSLTVKDGATLKVANSTYVAVENNVNVSGEIYVETQGAFVQNNDAGTFNLIGATANAFVNKSTPSKAQWYYYTAWSSPVKNETIDHVFPDVDGDRRFWFNAANFEDIDGDDIDDNGDDWQYAFAGTTMTPGVGYAVTEARLFMPGASGTATFEGEFNTGNIETTIYHNPLNSIGSWNLIGNPYPCALDFEAFHNANSSLIDGAAYIWSQATPPSSSNDGNQQKNFSKNDYAVITVGSGSIKASSSSTIPNGYIGSAQSFFVDGIDNGTATFTNAMRVADETSNSLFFKSTNSKNKTNTNSSNKLWVNLTSDNGVFNQILIAYVNGATNNDDGMRYDAPKAASDASAILYTQIENSTKKFAIQGKDANSINENEIIKLGFKTSINVATLYTLSIEQLEGDFLNSNNIYLKDNLLNKTHHLSTSDYTFTSEVGEFNNRFEIAFSDKSLSVEDILLSNNTLKIVELENDNVQFNTSNNLNIKTVHIFDLLGRQLYQFNGETASETYKLSNLNHSIFIAKVALSNGAVITKKAFKK